MPISDLQDRHYGEDIWVIGSGTTLTYLSPRFFDNKTVVATNLAADGLGLTAQTTYVHSHYHENVFFQQSNHLDWTFVAPEGDKGFEGRPQQFADNVLFYPHVVTGGDFRDPYALWHPEGLVVGSSSIHGSMHLAAFLGARNVILVGADCGTLDGNTNYTGYVDERGNPQSGDLIANGDVWLERWNRHLETMKDFLVNHYKVTVCSLLPFVNPNMEGHTFASFAGRIN